MLYFEGFQSQHLMWLVEVLTCSLLAGCLHNQNLSTRWDWLNFDRVHPKISTSSRAIPFPGFPLMLHAVVKLLGRPSSQPYATRKDRVGNCHGPIAPYVSLPFADFSFMNHVLRVGRSQQSSVLITEMLSCITAQPLWPLERQLKNWRGLT